MAAYRPIWISLVFVGIAFGAQLESSAQPARKCPEITSSEEECPPKTNECLTDNDCPTDTLCCSDGCNLACVSPEADAPIVKRSQLDSSELDSRLTLQPKKGTCPELSINQGECPPVNITNACLLDSDCPLDRKCCTDGCTLSCQEPIKGDVATACTVPVDLGFLIDASASIGVDNFLKIQDFVKKIVGAFEVGEKGTHVGAIWYSNDAEVAFDFKNFTGPALTKENVFKAVDGIKVTKGKTRIDKALRLAAKSLYSKSGGVREDKPKILLVMTDGRQTRGTDAPDAEDLHIASKPLKEQGVQVYSLGIGDDYDIGELLDIASDDASVFRAGDFDELLTIVASITKQTCKGCTRAVDVHFAIDSSNKMDQLQFDLMRNFLKAFSDKFILSNRGAHFSASVFGDDAKMVFNFHQAPSKEEFTRLVDTIPHNLDKQNNMDKALNLARTQAFSLEGGMRQGVPKVLVLVTAGNCANCKTKMSDAAQALKDKGVQIVALSIGNEVNRAELLETISLPPQRNLFEVQSVDKLFNAVFSQKVSEAICLGHGGVCPRTKRPEFCPNEAIKYNCQVDTDCLENEKCCLDPCDKSCVSKKLACERSIDLAIGLDNSARVTASNFQLLKNFASSLTGSFKIASAGSHMGVATFGKDSKAHFNFGRSYSSEKISGEIRNLPFVGSGSGDIGQMLKIAEEDLFSLKGRSRRGTPNVFLLVVQGPVDIKNGADVQKRAENLKAANGGVNLIVINIDQAGSKNEEFLKSIASKSSSSKDKKYFRFDSAIDLMKTENQLKIAKEACSASMQNKCPLVPKSDKCLHRDNECDSDFDCPGFYKCCPDACRRRCIPIDSDCKEKVDLLLMLDDSNRVGPTNFNKVRQFASRLLPSFKIKDGSTHVAAMTYSNTPKLAFGFNDANSMNTSAVASKIMSIPYSGGKNSRLDKGLEYAQKMFSLEGGARLSADVKQAIIIFTDGNTAVDSKRLDLASWPLRGRKELRIIAISVGDQINEKQLNNVVSWPISDNVFLASNYDDIQKNIKEVTQVSCSSAQIIPPAPIQSIPGPPGDPGPKGDTGPRGPKGDKGPTGGDGDVGGVGDKGPRGAKGDIGEQGLPGPAGGLTKGPDPLASAVGILAGQSGVAPTFSYLPGAEGPPGPPGNAGSRGDTGNRGETGGAGPKGKIGRRGPYGPQGPSGKDGKDGNRGPLGDSGDKGLGGPPGPAGPTGMAGGQGEFGYKGERGGVGAAGSQGDAGAAGSKGYAGEKGAQGDVGETGFVGIAGEEGSAGPAGARGPRGKQGAAGKPGEAGAEGYAGTPGPVGPNGPKGNQGLPGPRGNKGGQGEAGAAGQEGERGQPGTNGPTGKKGATGSKGGQGPAGPTGAQGLIGSEGSRGAQGPQGLIGSQGPKGDAGQRGSRGLAGAKGSEGAGGLRGPQGPQGPDGQPGSVGPVGKTGPQGQAGDIGQRGRNGDPGENGLPGTKGDPGELGSLGRLGEKGGRGTPGLRGDQGQSGPPGQAGAPGHPGKDGNQGPPGANGKDGSPGPPGAEGQQGFPGPVGQAGEAGDAGAQGKPGAPGAVGRKGAIGDAGSVGSPGQNGPQGEAGAQGEPGQQGSPGIGGTQGPPGPSGPIGSPGKDGAKGLKGSSGKNGPPGLQGERGPNGLEGPTGAQGAQGAPGEQGDTGETGARGDRGPRGPSGAAGAAGPPGPMGQRGSAGRRGSRGANGGKGQKAEAGADGHPGSPGLQGKPGRIGSVGPRGDRGADGANGLAGLDGPPGEQGSTGPPGLPGRNGAQGVPGPAGPQGDRGPKGSSGDSGGKGAQGPAGPPGTTGPVGPLGQKGRRGVIGELGELGEQGPPGNPGPIGPPGSTGLAGPPGSAGPAGRDGKSGARGDIGDPGIRGPTGSEGASGKDGIPGKSGNAGKSGVIGPAGPRGPSGNRGTIGLTGPPGFIGMIGMKGPKGYPGLNGKDGSNGKRGEQGRTGPQGPPGSIGQGGPAGTDGVPGTNGLPGSDGRAGEKGYRGNPGAAGVTGDIGQPGGAGPKGVTGEDGYTGKAGKEGKAGAKGDIGDDGPQGTSGAAGAQGAAGRNGQKGTQGATGIPGDPGDVGMKGNKGYAGVQGPPGVTGNRGNSGVVGGPGKKGPTGSSGLDGPKGNDGPYGDSGEYGKPGASGPAGPPGPPGPPGVMQSMSGAFSGYLTAGGLQKGPAYGYGQYGYGYRQYSSGVSGSEDKKVVDTNLKTLYEYLDLLKHLEDTKSSTGTQKDPARTCKDLFMRFPDKPSGDYWIDPNEGSKIDMVRVYCNKITNETCIYPKQPLVEKEKWHSGRDQYKWAMQDLMSEIEGVLYAAEIRQMKVMKLFSTRARQEVKYFCKNSHAWMTHKGKMARKTVKFLTDNEQEVHGHSIDIPLKPGVQDGCKMKDGKWHETVFKFDTDKLEYMPILDVAAHDIGDGHEKFGLEIGPICFS